MFEYVASGLGKIRSQHSYFESSPDVITSYGEWLDLCREDWFKVSGLYNAYTEKNFPVSFKRTGVHSKFDSIYSDSGGLQMVTLGKNITTEMRDAIYKNQATHSKYAMCFDEIPLEIDGRSGINDVGSRFFNPSAFDECAAQTGKNIERQIDIFQDMESDTKPVLILHGQNYEHFSRWSEILLKNVKQEYHKYLTSVALSSACIGQSDFLSEIEKSFLVKQLPLEVDHMHILGAGSLRRLMGNVVFFANGYYEPEFTVSFDSTTHTKLAMMGSYWRNGSILTLSRTMNDKYQMIYDDIMKKKNINLTLNEFFEGLTNSATDYNDKYNSKETVITSAQAVCFSSIYNFKEYLDKARNSKKFLLSLVKKDHKIFDLLYDVKTLDDFNHWKTNYSRYLPKKQKVGEKIMNPFDDLI